MPIKYDDNAKNTKTIVDDETVNFEKLSQKEKAELSTSDAEYHRMVERAGDTANLSENPEGLRKVVQKIQNKKTFLFSFNPLAK